MLWTKVPNSIELRDSCPVNRKIWTQPEHLSRNLHLLSPRNRVHIVLLPDFPSDCHRLEKTIAMGHYLHLHYDYTERRRGRGTFYPISSHSSSSEATTTPRRLVGHLVGLKLSFYFSFGDLIISTWSALSAGNNCRAINQRIGILPQIHQSESPGRDWQCTTDDLRTERQ